MTRLDIDWPDAAAERAFRTYLDEYTEVSRLTVAGGYVHGDPARPGQPFCGCTVRATHL